MKRPEGFDPKGTRSRAPSAPSDLRTRAPGPATRTPAPIGPRAKGPERERPSSGRNDERRAARERRKAARARRRFERGEVRRFTRRSRHRRLAWLGGLGLVAGLLATVLVAVYSPILALRTIDIEGTSRVDPEQLRSAVGEQLGTPLALIDFDQITAALGAFPLIRSYVTRTVPPDTLVIQVVERQPVGSIFEAGVYRLVDPAGIEIETSVDRVPGIPLIELDGEGTDGAVFDSVVEVLLALPAPLLAQVDTIAAGTQDDVSLVLTGIGQRVVWGSAADSAEKAAVLAALISVTEPGRAGQFDVSAPGNAVFRPG